MFLPRVFFAKADFDLSHSADFIGKDKENLVTFYDCGKEKFTLHEYTDNCVKNTNMCLQLQLGGIIV